MSVLKLLKMIIDSWRHGMNRLSPGSQSSSCSQFRSSIFSARKGSAVDVNNGPGPRISSSIIFACFTTCAQDFEAHAVLHKISHSGGGDQKLSKSRSLACSKSISRHFFARGNVSNGATFAAIDWNRVLPSKGLWWIQKGELLLSRTFKVPSKYEPSGFHSFNICSSLHAGENPHKDM